MRDIVRAPLMAAISLALLGACAGTREQMVREGYPLAYADGFDDGCHSGKQAAGSLFDRFRKDVRRFDSDRRYAQGWSDGFRQCETEQEAAQRQARMAIEQQQLRELRKSNDSAAQRHLEREVLRGVDTRGLENLKK